MGLQPCLGMRLGGVSGGKAIQGWRASSHTAIGEAADGNSDVSGKTFALPVDGGAACRTEMKGQRVAALSRPLPRRGPAGKGHLLAAKARLVANHGAGAALALQAMTHGDARWLALDRKAKLATAAGGVSGHHNWLRHVIAFTLPRRGPGFQTRTRQKKSFAHQSTSSDPHRRCDPR